MSSTLTEQTGTGISPPPRPSVWRVGWATFVGYLFAVVAGLLVVIPLATTGLAVFNTPGRGVFLHFDVWSWLAEASVGLLATFVTAWFVGMSLRDRTNWEVPFGFTFATLLLTGYAPLLALTPLYGATSPVSLIAATLILRWRAEPAGAEPLKALGAVPRRHRRKVVIGLALAGPLMFGYAVAYSATHPLRVTGSTDVGVMRHHPGKLVRYDVYLDNPGPFAVTDLSIVGIDGSPVLQLERVGSRSWAGGRLLPLKGYRARKAGSDDPITLELRQGRVCPPGIAKLDAIRVRYTVLDGRHEERIPLSDPPRVRCP